jgi:hypothetical protein
MARLVALTVADAPDAWRDLGFGLSGDAAYVGGVAHRLDAGRAGRGITGWQVSGVALPPGPHEVDGLRTMVEEPEDAGDDDLVGATFHPNGVVAIDHVVVATPDHDRTLAALQAGGMRLLRTRTADTYGAPMVQGFFRLGPVVVEVVGPAEPAGDGPAQFFGIAFTVADLDATARYLGARLHPATDAVQPGRRIATLDREAGVRTRLAFMSPDVA